MVVCLCLCRYDAIVVKYIDLIGNNSGLFNNR